MKFKEWLMLCDLMSRYEKYTKRWKTRLRNKWIKDMGPSRLEIMSANFEILYGKKVREMAKEFLIFGQSVARVTPRGVLGGIVKITKAYKGEALWEK